MKLKFVAAAVAAACLSVPASAANYVTFFLTYAGAPGSAASATGQVDIDTDIFAVNSTSGQVIGSGLRNISLTVTAGGTSTSFGDADFSGYVLRTSDTALDYGRELLGQPLAGGGTFGPDGSGDFNLFSTTPGTPSGIGRFVLDADGTRGTVLRLTSFSAVAAAPEASAWAMMIAGFGVAGGALRRTRRTGATGAAG